MCLIKDGFQRFHWCPAVKIPSELEGWQDITHLQSLSDEDKKLIHQQQDNLGIPITQFVSGKSVIFDQEGKTPEPWPMEEEA
jgi:hypothetical protein